MCILVTLYSENKYVPKVVIGSEWVAGRWQLIHEYRFLSFGSITELNEIVDCNKRERGTGKRDGGHAMDNVNVWVENWDRENGLVNNKRQH